MRQRRMWSVQLVTLARPLVVVMVLVTGVLCGCPVVKNEGKARFTREMGKLEYVRLHQYRDLLCCASGYDSIAWHRLEAGKWVPFPHPSNSSSTLQPATSPDGQYLHIKRAEIGDGTRYKCGLVKNSTVVLENFVRLKVMVCEVMQRGPILTDPFPQNQTIDELGGSVTFLCTGYFGCSLDMRVIMWQVDGKDIEDAGIARYNVTEVSSDNQDIIQAILTVSPVEEVDLNRKFTCLVASPQLRESETRIEARIFKKEQRWKLYVTIFGGVIAGVMVVIIVGAIMYKLYGPQIKLLIRSRFPKPINEEGLEHNIFVYHADDDHVVAEEIREKLKEENYQVFMTSDVGGNQAYWPTVTQQCSKSAVVAFLYSKNLREDNMSNLLLLSLFEDRGGQNIIFIVIDQYDVEEVVEWTEDGLQRRQRRTEMREADPNATEELELEDENSVEVLYRRNGNVDQNNQDTVAPDLKDWKILPRFKYPSKDSSKRKQRNFWCSFFLKIPKFSYQLNQGVNRNIANVEEARRGRHSSSGQPLLQEEPRTPTLIDETASGIVTPNRDEVFEYNNPNNDVQVAMRNADQGNPAYLPSTSGDYNGTEAGGIAAEVGTQADNQGLNATVEIHKASNNEHEEKPDENAVTNNDHEKIFTMSDDEGQVKSFDSDTASVPTAYSPQVPSSERSESKDRASQFSDDSCHSPVSSPSSDTSEMLQSLEHSKSGSNTSSRPIDVGISRTANGNLNNNEMFKYDSNGGELPSGESGYGTCSSDGPMSPCQ